ncbi:alkyl hydroperoxide reductase AhpD [Sphaerisporangium rufum]|uniref:Alkyl hydroperoxide reductase AhpD n=1 Tax=Sphaerisporangium rufum TaxID=1381558 RepID=A0A919QXZ7_9ACTN|nr:carboxymuconolactone decarboxylase family protein [Sphaerisporangium rufum]GII76209.1 alkyl hydroperoxide reductase AhpD [Sphaerisporangium rufum]
MGKVLTRLTLPGVLGQVRHVTPVPPRAAEAAVARVYAQAARDFGMLAPPILLHSPAAGPLAASWTMLRESLLAAGTVPRVVKETVAAGVSAANACPYCVDVHQATGDALARSAGPAGDPPAPADGIAGWARRSGTAAPAGPPAPAGQARELIAVAVTFHYLNRMVGVFLGESPLPPGLPVRARRRLLRLFGTMMRPAARRAAVPGESLTLLPAAALPADLAFAHGDPNLAGAFARAAAAIDRAGRRSVPGPVRELVADRLAGWDGEPPGLGRGWAADAAAGLAPEHRPAGRLALLTAMAAYQVDDRVIGEYRAGTPGDPALVELTSWASMAAARRVAAGFRPAVPAGARPRDARGRFVALGGRHAGQDRW